MQWRRLQLDWKYAVGELIIVIVGVLIALGIQQWNDNRLDRIEEQVILDQLAADVRADIRAIRAADEPLKKKEASLLRLVTALRVGRPGGSNADFLTDIVLGANFGWNQGHAQRSSFDELLGSGRLSLVQSAELRSRISNYYAQWAEYNYRSEERETVFPAMSYQLVPRKFIDPSAADQRNVRLQIAGAGDEFGILLFDPNIPVDEVTDLVSKVFESELQEHVIAELNFARFVQRIMYDLLADASDLEAKLEEYRSQLQ